MTDALLDELYELLFLGAGGPLVASRMALRPDPAASSHFIAAPRPVLTRDDMARVSTEGLLAEVGRVLDDLPPERRDEVIGKVSAIIAALRCAAAAETQAEPSSLTYTLH